MQVIGAIWAFMVGIGSVGQLGPILSTTFLANGSCGGKTGRMARVTHNVLRDALRAWDLEP